MSPFVRTMSDVGKEERINFRLGPELLQTLRTYGQRYERSDADVIREALWQFLESKSHGPTRKRGGRRKK